MSLILERDLALVEETLANVCFLVVLLAGNTGEDSKAATDEYSIPLSSASGSSTGCLFN